MKSVGISMRKWRPVLLWLVLFLPVIVNGVASLETMRLELVHRHAPQAAAWEMFDKMPERTQTERVRELLASDGARERMRRQASEARGRRKRNSSSGEMPINSAADYGTGQYFVALMVGSPAQRVTLIADTGSDLTWMNCEYRGCGGGVRGCAAAKRRSRSRRRRRVKAFRADASLSFDTVPCFSAMCKVELMNLFSLARCPTPLTPCAFDYRYSDGSAALGIFANETVTLALASGRKRKVYNVLVGCTQSVRGQSFRAADGVLGLGFSKYSFSSAAAPRFGGKFSYCLMDHLSPKNISNYLTFGKPPNSPSGMRFTNLVLGALTPFYAVNVLGISIGGIMLDIPAQVWDVNGVGGTILDSGSSLTSLTQPAYKSVMAALTPVLDKFKKVDLDIGPLEYCFNSTGFNTTEVPKLVIHFVGGARFDPPVKNYVIDAADGVKCLGFVSVAWPGTSVIGNIMQQNHLWQFDLLTSKLGFAPSDCS